MSTLPQRYATRRALLQGGVGGGLAGARLLSGRRLAAASTSVRVMTATSPDPVPPGVARYAETSFAQWQRVYGVRVDYEAVALPQLHRKLGIELPAGGYSHDLIYTAGWVPEFQQYLAPLDDLVIPPAISNDLFPSAHVATNWRGSQLGLPFTTSLLTLWFNRDLTSRAGITTPPATWDEFKRAAAEMTGNGTWGWTHNLAPSPGIGGLASTFMAFLQQAGGTMWDDDGLPRFASDAGIEALQFLTDLVPYADPSSLTATSVLDATGTFMSGTIGMMLNWPFMWSLVQDPQLSVPWGKVDTAILPAGPAGSASIDGADGWSLLRTSEQPELASRLMLFYLDARVQKAQALETGWLPARRTVLADPELQAIAPHAAAVLAQADLPFNSFLTPEYDTVTASMGEEIHAALTGSRSPNEALTRASEAVTAIAKARPSA